MGRWTPARLTRALPGRRSDRPAESGPAAGEAAGAGRTISLATTFRALRNRNYRLFYFGQTISLCGTWMQTIGQAWLVLQITDSKVALGTVTMLQFLPITIFVLFAGVIADRVPKRRFIITTQLLAMSQAFTLATLVWSGRVELWHVYVLAAVLGLANAFEQPTRQAFIIEMVGKDDLMNAVALNSGMFNAARLIGPAIGGFIIAGVGVKVAFLLNGISFLPVIAGLLLMRASEMHASERRVAGPTNAIGELREGLGYAFRTPSAFLIVILVAFMGMFGYNFVVTLPLIDHYVLHRGATGLGWMTSAVGMGALVAALTLANRERVARSTLFAGCLAFGLLLGAVAISRWFPLTIVFLLMLGVANTTFGATANTSMQLAAPDHLRGRMMALYMLLFAGSTPIGGFLTGFMADRLGVQTAVGIQSGMCLLGASIGLLYYLSHRQQIGHEARAFAATT